MGSIRKRGKIWYLDYCYQGRRIRKKSGTSKRLAQLALNEIEIKIEKGELGFLPKDSDLEKLFKEFSNYSKTNHSPSTVKRYRAILDHFKAYLTQYYPNINKISQLIPKIFEDYKAHRKSQGAKPKTINIELQTIKSIFTLAVKWGYAYDNPAKDVVFLKVTKKEEARFLTKEECSKLLAACNEWQYPIFYTFLNTGMRKQELMNLEWQDVDFDRRIIKIRVKDNWTPKTEERNIHMGKGLLLLLKEHKDKTEQGELVFHEDGEKIGDNKLRKELMKVTKRCGLPDVTRLHTLRHTFASHLVMKGATLPAVQKLMGHADIQTTMIYSHLAAEHLTKAVDLLDF